MRLVVFGANGGVGRRAVVVAAERGHQVVAAARTPPVVPPGVVPALVDVRDAVAVRLAVEGADAVLWCVGVTRRSGPDVGRQGLAHMVAAGEEMSVRRLVTVSGAGTTVVGDQKGVGARLASAVSRRLAAAVVADKQAEHLVLSSSGLDWTEVRPPRLSDVDGPERWVLVEQGPGLTARPVAKVDVARAMVSLVENRDWVRRSPFLVAAP